MYTTAVVDDEREQRELLQTYLRKYEKENGKQLDICLFEEAESFLENERSEYDIVFLDIQMPGITHFILER